MNDKTDTELIEWLNDHAILLGVIKDDGETEYIKVEGADLCFRDIVIQLSRDEVKNE